MSNASPAVSPAVAAILARFDRTSPDNLLVSLAAEILRLTRAHADLAARLQAVEQLQAIADRLLPDAPGAAVALPKTVVIDATQSMLDASGFYPLEFDKDGNPLRWTGPSKEFSLTFFIDRSAGGKFKLSFSRFAASVSASFMRCLLDGKPADIAVHDQRGGFELSGVLPPRGDSGATVLSFIVPGTSSLAQLGQSTDQRQLGLCFQRLTAQSSPAPEAPPAVRKTKRGE